MADFFNSIDGLIKATRIPEQLSQVDAGGLFTNAYFLVPFIILVAYLLYKQAFSYLILLGIGIGVWIVSGTQYMQELIIDGQIQTDKVLPVAFGAIIVLGVLIYLLFIRSD